MGVDYRLGFFRKFKRFLGWFDVIFKFFYCGDMVFYIVWFYEGSMMFLGRWWGVVW